MPHPGLWHDPQPSIWGAISPSGRRGAPPRRSDPCCPISGRRAIRPTACGVVIAAVFLVLAKGATVYVPIVYGRAVDALAPKGHAAGAVLVVPAALIVAYGLLRVASQGFGELRDAVFAAVQQRTAPQSRVADLRAPARAVAALPSGSPDRRAVAGHRSRHQRHPVGAAAGCLQRHPDAVRDADGDRHHLGHLRLALRAADARRGRRLSRLHARLHQCARAHPPHHERHRQRGADPRDRQPAELRDGEVFRQRGARGGAFRRLAGPLRARGGEEPGVAEHAEPGPGGDHRRRARRRSCCWPRAACAPAR